MPGTMSLPDLMLELRDSLHGADEAFAEVQPDGEEDTGTGEDQGSDAAMKRFLIAALPDMQIKRPLTKLASVSLIAGMPQYSLANVPDFAAYKSHLWSSNMPRPWEPHFPGALPRVFAVRDAEAWWLGFETPPTTRQITALGSVFRFWYMARHVLGADATGTTIAEEDKGLLLLRAQAEAMREMALRNANKPINMRDGLSGVTRNSTPAALCDALLKQFREAA